MSIDKVKRQFETLGIEGRIRELPTSSATVALAALALGCDEAHIAKTLAFQGQENVILVVTAGDCKVDNHKFKETFHIKAKMIPKEDTEAKVGHAPGGVCPFAVLDGVAVYLDDSLKRFSMVYPACGSENSAIGLTLDELQKYSNAIGWVDVTAPRSEKS